METNNINIEKCYKLYYKVMLNHALYRTSCQDTAEDLVQESFIAAYFSKDKFNHLSSEKTWLFSILNHKIADHYRKPSTKFSQNFSSMADFFKYDQQDVDDWKWLEIHQPKELNFDNMETSQLNVYIDLCISKLTEKQQKVIENMQSEQGNRKQICKELEITEKNLWVILHRARLQLRECLQKNYFN